MRHGILRSLQLLLAASGLSVLLAPQAYGQEEETVEEIRERIREEEEEAEEEAQQDTEEDKYSGCNLFGDILSALLQSPSEEDGGYYPEDRSRPFLYLLRGEPPPGYSRWGYVGLDVDGACLFQNRWSLTGWLTFNLQYLHLHAFSQILFDPTGCLVCYAANAGLNILSHFLILNLFAGAFGTDLTTGALLDFGAEARIFLTARWILELYSLNAVYYSLQFNFLSLALRYAGSRVSLGAGLNLNNYAGVVLAGPSLRLCLWL
jgi:hypothetical protein